MSLKRNKKELYYYKTTSGKEVDFYVKEGESQRELIQVAWDIEDEKTRKRELTALREAMEEQKLDTGLLLTNDTDDAVTLEGKRIVIKSVYQWLVEV